MSTFGRSFEDNRSIKVLVVPIGENSFFQEQYNAVSKNKSFSVAELTKPSSWKTKTSLMKSFNWQNGNLVYEYLRYDRMPQGPSGMENFQSSRRILVIVGVINYPELKDHDKVERELLSFAHRYPSVIIKRYFVFNYTFDASPTAKKSTPSFLSVPHEDPDSIIVLPPSDGVCEGGSMVDVHVKEVMSVVCVKTLITLDNQLSLMEQGRTKGSIPVNLTTLSTSYDDIEESVEGGASKLRAQIRKKPNGRARKWMGDLCMQACSPLDAMELYISSIADCRALNDPMWLSGSLEGYIGAVALVLKLQIVPMDDLIGKDIKSLNLTGSSQLSDHIKVLRLAEDRIGEALQNYSRFIGFATFEVDLTLRLARLAYDLGYLHGDKELWRGKILDYVMRAVAVPGLNSVQQVEVTLEGGTLCQKIGLPRKHALLTYIAALISAEGNQVYMANDLLKKASLLYGVVIEPPSGISKSVSVNIFEDQNWPSISRSLLLYSTQLAKECNDLTYATGALAGYLRLLGTQEAHSYNLSRNWSNIQSRLSNSSTNSIGFPIIPQLPNSLSESSPPVMTPRKQSTAGEPGTLSEETLRSHSVSIRGSSYSQSRNSQSITNQSIATSLPSYLGGVPATVFRSKSTTDSSVLGDTVGNDSTIARRSQAIFQPVSVETTESRNLSSLIPAELTDSLKAGLRTISVPKSFPTSFASFVQGEDSSLGTKPSTFNYYGKKKSPIRIRRPIINAVYQMTVNNAPDITSSNFLNGEVFSAISSYLSKHAVSREQQCQAWNLLTLFTRSLKPATSVYLPVPLLSARPKLLPLHLRPVSFNCESLLSANKMLEDLTSLLESNSEEMKCSTERNSAANADISRSSLFYDPFAAKRAKTNAAVQPSIATWSVGCPGFIRIAFSNPFSIGITIDKVNVVATGPAHLVHPCEAVYLPPHTPITVFEVMVVPLEVGNLLINAVEIFLNNVKSCFSLDKQGDYLPAFKGVSTTKLSNISDDNPDSIANTTIAISKGIVVYDIITSSRSSYLEGQSSASTSSSLAREEIALQLFRGQLYHESLCLRANRYINQLRPPLGMLDYRIIVSWWVPRTNTMLKPGTTSILSKLNPLIKKQKMFRGFAIPCLVADAPLSAGDEECPISSLIHSVNSQGDVIVEFDIKGSNNASQKISIDIETLSTSEQSVIDIISKHEALSSIIEKLKNGSLASDDAETLDARTVLDLISNGTIVTPLTMSTRIYSVDFNISRLVGVLDVTRSDAVLPRTIESSDNALHPTDRRILSTLLALVASRGGRAAYTSSACLTMFSSSSSTLLKLSNNTLSSLSVQFFPSDGPAHSPLTIEPRGILTICCSSESLSPGIDPTKPPRIEWNIVDSDTSSVGFVARTKIEGSTPIIYSNPSGLRDVKIETWYSKSYSRESPCWVKAPSDKHVELQTRMAVLFRFVYPSTTLSSWLTQSCDLSPFDSAVMTLKLAVVIIEDVDEFDLSDSSALPSDSAFPKSVLVNGSLFKSLHVHPHPDNQSVTQSVEHLLGLQFLKAGSYRIFPCFRKEQGQGIMPAFREGNTSVEGDSEWLCDYESIRVKVST